MTSVREIKRAIIGALTTHTHDKPKRNSLIAGIAQRCSVLSEGKMPSFPELTPEIKKINTIITYINGKIAELNNIEREKFYKQLSEELFSYLGYLSSVANIFDKIDIFYKIASYKLDWAEFSEQLNSDPKLYEEYIRKHKERQEKYIQKQLLINEDKFIQRKKIDNQREAEQKKKDMSELSLRGLMVKLRVSLADRKSNLVRSNRKEELQKFNTKLKIVNVFREKVTDIMGDHLDGLPNTFKLLPETIRLGKLAAETTQSYGVIHITIHQILKILNEMYDEYKIHITDNKG